MITRKKALGIITLAVIAFAIVMHVPSAEALITPILDADPYGDGSVLVAVTAEHIIDTGWDLHYAVSAVGRDIRYMSFGLADPDTNAIYSFIITPDDYDALPAAAFDPVTDNSFFPYFNPSPLAAGMTYEFTVHFLGDGSETDHSPIFDGGQRMTFRDVMGAMASLTATYTQPHNPGGDADPIPEPGTLLILGTGIVALGLWSNRKRRK